MTLWIRFRSSTWLICTTIFVATFTDGFVYGIVVPVLPFSLVERSGVKESEVQFWLSTLLALHGASMAVVSPIAGWLADRISSRKSPFFVGLGLLFGSTALFAFGSTPGALVVARCLQGASCALVYTVGLALLVDTVGRDRVGAWMGFVLSGMTNGVMVGPLLGGLIYAKAGYYAVFVVVLAVIAADAVLRLMMVEKKRSNRCVKQSNEENGYGTFSISSSDTAHSNFTGPRAADQGSFDDSLERISEQARDYKTAYSSGPNGENDTLMYKDQKPIATNAHSSTQSYVSRYFSNHFPTIFALLGSPRLIAAMYGAFVELSLVSSFDSILPRFVHKTFGWESTGGGVIFLAITVPSLTGPLLGVLSDRLGTRAVVLGGFGLCTVALALLSLVSQGGMAQVVFLCILLALIGVGSTAILTPLAADMSHVVEAMSIENESLFGQNGAYAQAYGLFDLALAFGQMLGPTFGGFVYEKWGWRTTVWSLAAFSASGVIPIFCFTSCKK